MYIANRLICAGRSLYYSTEWLKLRCARFGWVPDTRPLVSVYIPTHNRIGLLLERALPSVRAQSYRHIEIIVAAHGCTDGTAQRLVGYDPRLRVIEVPRTQTYPPTAENHWLAGPVVPANAALEACSGQWIARIDDDDTWNEDHIAKLLNFAYQGGHEFVSSAHETHLGRIDPYDLDGVLVGGTQTWLYRSYLKFFRYNPDCWRKTWNRVNDTDLQQRMRNAGVRMGYFPEVTAYVLPRPGDNVVGLQAYQDNKREIEKNLAFR